MPKRTKVFLAVLMGTLFLVSTPRSSFAQGSGTLRGTVTLDTTGRPVHGVVVTILQLQRSTVTGDDGVYEFANVPPGRYSVATHLDRVPDVVETVQVTESTTTADIQLRLRIVGEQVTVTATGDDEAAFNSIQAVTFLTSTEISEKNTQSLGDVLEDELGVAKRTFGPGTSRPVVRGFDGDRLLVLQDGNRIGALGFQSGDHAEPIDLINVDKLEVVRGPATLLYGSESIGGVVNAVTSHDEGHPGLRGYITGLGSSNNWQGGGGGGFEYGSRKFLLWGSGSGQRAGDYQTPIGRITNSYTRDGAASGGAGYFGDKGFFSANYAFNKRRYGIPFDPDEAEPEIVYLNPRRHSVGASGGVRNMDSGISGARFSFQYNDYKHQEISAEEGTINTEFRNKMFTYQGMFDQRKAGAWGGNFGVWGLHRDYTSSGEEALAPPVKANGFALFALEKAELERVTFQFGGRYEHNRYSPEEGVLDRETPGRSYNTLSAAAGLRVTTWPGGAFLANYNHSERAPALEELYNEGPHAGNQTFEIGDPNLKREREDGFDVSLRQSNKRVRAEFNYFYYHFSNFIFLAPTGDTEDGLLVANYAQGAARYTGTEARFDAGLHPNFWLKTKLDYVNAELTDESAPLPRIPPLRGTLGLEWTYKGLRAAPEVVMAKDQNRLFPTETRTAGYTIFNANVSYTFAQQHAAHTISVTSFNLGDRLYRNHLSFIKEFAPEIGRGVRLAYTVRFY